MSSSPIPVTRELAEYATGVSFDVLPERVIFRAKCVILDDLACMILGRSLPAGSMTARYVIEAGGSPDATVTGTRIRTAPALAAMANGTAGHADELDGAHLTEGHVGVSVLAACLAVAEKEGSNGRDFITAIVLGWDIGTRLVDAVGGRLKLQLERHLHSDFLHAFGGAAATGYLLNLNADQQRHAAALTACQTISLAAFFDERNHLSKSFTYGHIAHSAVTAALLAKLGMEGNDAVFEAPHGVLAAWSDGTNAKKATQDLGDYYAIVDSNIKFYSAGYPIHSSIEASLGLMADHSLTSDRISKISVKMNTNCVLTVDNRDMPSICIQDMLPVAVALGRLGFKEAHNEENLRLPEVERLRKLVDVEIDPRMDEVNPRGRGATVVLTTDDDQVLERTIEWPYGHCRRGDVTWDELAQKVHTMLEDLLSEHEIDRLISTVGDLDSGTNIEDLAQAMQSDITELR